MTQQKSSTSRKGASRLARTIRSLLVIAGIGASLAALNIFTNSRDVGLATGQPGPAQHDFFVAAAERPDLELFYKGLSHAQRMAMAERLGNYDEPSVAKVAVTLLGTFDADAREALGDSLVKIARKKPESVVGQLTVSGSFQQLAISKAVQAVGAPAIPLVAAQLSNTDASANAASLLVDLGPSVVPNVLPLLQDKDSAVRLAASDVLGKLREPSAVPGLTDLYQKSEGDDKLAYLSALATIGDPRSEGLLRDALVNSNYSIATRSQAALGLGRVGTDSAAAVLEPFVYDPDRAFADSAFSGLVLAGDEGIKARQKGLSPSMRVRIAGNLRTPNAMALIRDSLLASPTLEAADAAAHWDEMAPVLAQAIRRTQDGDVLDHIAKSLATTEPGRQALESMVDDPVVGGYAFRRLKMSAS